MYLLWTTPNSLSIKPLKPPRRLLVGLHHFYQEGPRLTGAETPITAGISGAFRGPPPDKQEKMLLEVCNTGWEGLVKMQVLVQQVCCGARESAFLRSSW